jgi:hypothetical protein
VTRARSKIAGAVAVAGALFAALVAVGTAGAARHDPGYRNASSDRQRDGHGATRSRRARPQPRR